MSILAYQHLHAAFTERDPAKLAERYWLEIEDYDPSILQPASFELHVGTSYARWRHNVANGVVASSGVKRLADIDETDYVIHQGLAPGDGIEIASGEGVLVAVDRYLKVPTGLRLAVYGKSSVGRKFQIIHTAGYVDPGFEGVLVLECLNFAPFTVVYTVGEPICQVEAAILLSETSMPYGRAELGSKYKGQRIVQPPKRSTSTFAGAHAS